MLPAPFNSVEEFVLWSGFEQGESNGQNSVLEGTFSFGMFQTALRESRREIYIKTLRKQNDDFTEERAAELKEAERYLATARLFPNFGTRIQIKFPESNAQNLGEFGSGPDTPSPAEKGRQYVEFMASRFRRIGLELLESPSTRYQVTVGTDTWTEQYPCLSRGARYGSGLTYGCEEFIT